MSKDNKDQIAVNALNKTLDAFAPNFIYPQPIGRTRFLNLDTNEPLSLESDNVAVFDKAVNELIKLAFNDKIGISSSVLTDRLSKLISQKRKSNSRFIVQDWHSLVSDLRRIEISKFRVLRPIHGAHFDFQGEPLKFGLFTIYSTDHHMAQIRSGLTEEQKLSPFGELNGLLIECTVEARDSDTALNLADSLFHQCELIIRFLIGHRTADYEIGILNYVGPRSQQRIIISNGRSMGGLGLEGAVFKVPLSNQIFCNPGPEIVRLLNLIGARQVTHMETRILRCTEWIGQALSEQNPASAFIKAATALEVLFNQSERGVITASIMALISESCATLLGQSPEGGVMIEKRVKALYDVRSKVVHTGSNSVDQSDLNTLVQICRAAVFELLTREDLRFISDISQLGDYFKKKKYEFLGQITQISPHNREEME